MAVKLVAPARDGRTLQRELRALSALDHPNVLRVHDGGTVDRTDGPLVAGGAWVAIERAEGDLARLRPIHADAIHDALAQILEGLAHAHAHGIVHRDLKPENVLKVGDRWKLGDFGLALRVEDVRGIGRAGTPSYMAPEQLRGQLDAIGPWTDLYALGCVAWELVTGRPPFAGTSVDDVVAAHLSQAPTSPPGLSAAWRGWLDALLAKDASARPAFAADARAALLALQTGWAPTARPDPARTFSATVDLDALPDAPPAPADGPVCGIPPARYEPGGWRPAAVHEPVPRHGAALGLLGLRALRLCGRQAERQRAWAALGRVHADRRAVGLWVAGDAGIGKSALLGWLGHQAHERGAARVVWRTRQRFDPLPDVGQLERADRPTLLVLDPVDADPEGLALATRLLGARGAETVPCLVALAADAGALRADPALGGELERLVRREDRLPLGPQEPFDAEEIVRQLVAIDEQHLRDRVARSEGHPGWLVAEVERSVRGGDAGRGGTRVEVALDGHGEDGRMALEVLAASERPLPAADWARAMDRLGLHPDPRLLDDARAAGAVTGIDPLAVASPDVRSGLVASAVAAGRSAHLHRVLAELCDDPYHRGRHRLLAGAPAEAAEDLGQISNVDGPQRLQRVRLWRRALEESSAPPEALRWCRYTEAQASFARGDLDGALAEAAALLAAEPPTSEAATDCRRLVAHIELVRGRLHPETLAQDPAALTGTELAIWLKVQAHGRARGHARPWLDRLPSRHAQIRVWAARIRHAFAVLDGDLAEAHRAIALGKAATDPHDAVTMGFNAALDAYQAVIEQRYGDAADLGRQALDSARASGNLYGLRNAHLLLAEAASGTGELPVALDLLDACVEIERVTSLAHGESASFRARALLRAGRVDDAASAVGAHPELASRLAKADLAAEWLALRVATAATPAARREAERAFREELATGGARTPTVAITLRLGAQWSRDPREARALGDLADQVAAGG